MKRWGYGKACYGVMWRKMEEIADIVALTYKGCKLINMYINTKSPT